MGREFDNSLAFAPKNAMHTRGSSFIIALAKVACVVADSPSWLFLMLEETEAAPLPLSGASLATTLEDCNLYIPHCTQR